LKLQSAIQEIETQKEESDEDLKIDLQFLMSEESEESFNEEKIADRVKSEIAKPRKLIRSEMQNHDGVCTMINGDKSNIL
jgi:hypothetical protein